MYFEGEGFFFIFATSERYRLNEQTASEFIRAGCRLKW